MKTPTKDPAPIMKQEWIGINPGLTTIILATEKRTTYMSCPDFLEDKVKKAIDGVLRPFFKELRKHARRKQREETKKAKLGQS